MTSHTLPGIGIQGGWSAGDTWTSGGNANWLALSSLTQLVAIGVGTTLPGSPAQGTIYILTAAAGSNAKAVAVYDNSAWTYFQPSNGWRAYNTATSLRMIFNGTDWVQDADTSRTATSGGTLTSGVISGGTATNLALTSGVISGGTATTLNLNSPVISGGTDTGSVLIKNRMAVPYTILSVSEGDNVSATKANNRVIISSGSSLTNLTLTISSDGAVADGEEILVLSEVAISNLSLHQQGGTYINTFSIAANSGIRCIFNGSANLYMAFTM